MLLRTKSLYYTDEERGKSERYKHTQARTLEKSNENRQ